MWTTYAKGIVAFHQRTDAVFFTQVTDLNGYVTHYYSFILCLDQTISAKTRSMRLKKYSPEINKTTTTATETTKLRPGGWVPNRAADGTPG